MTQRTDFGVLYGQKTTGEDSLLIYSSYEDAKASPKKGDFIVLTPKNEEGQKYLARVEAEIYDEDPIFRSQDKTLVAVHYARIAERELSERDKQKMFSYTYKVQMLGSYTHKGLDFSTAVRKLPVVSYHARHINQSEIDNIINKQDSKGVSIGHLCIGEDIHTDKGEIRFDINRLRSRRTMVFAQSGFGKTNLVKVLLYHAMDDTSFGKLIFDLNGEYVLDSKNTLGLGSTDKAKHLVVYTDKDIPKGYIPAFKLAGKVRLNMHKNLSVGDILTFGAGFSEVMKSFLLYLDDESVGDFVENINTYANNPYELRKKYPDFWSEPKDTKQNGDYKEDTEDKSARKTISAIRKRVKHLIDEGSLHSRNSTMVENIFEQLKAGKTVVVDLSLKDSADASIISTIIVRKLFEYNKEQYTKDESQGVIETVIFVEEAQNVLSTELVRTNANPFVRTAKEGRKFGIGMVTITQRPSAISDEIRTQAENFFAFHMGNSDDVKSLIKSNIHYDGVIASFIQRETIKGNLYLVTSESPFAVPIRVHEFEKLAKNQR